VILLLKRKFRIMLTLKTVITFPIMLTKSLTAWLPDTKKKSLKNRYSLQALSSNAKC